MLKKKTPPLNRKPETQEERVAGEAHESRMFFDCSPVATVVIKEDGIITRANEKFSELSGFLPGQVEGRKHWKEFVAPDDIDRLESFHREILKPDGWIPPVSTFGFIRKGNTTLPGMLTARRIHGTTLVIATITDGSVQKKLEKLLRTNEERYRKMVNNLNIGLYKTRPDQPGKCLWGNPALVRMYGCDSFADYTRRPIQDYYANPEDRERFIAELMTKGSVQDFEVQHRKKDGTPFWVRMAGFPKKREDGSVEWIEGSIEDINTDRVAVLACETGRQYLHEMLDSALGVGIICTDMDGTITLFNKGAELLLGYTAGEVIGKESPLVFHTESELTSRSRILTERERRLVTGFEILMSPLFASSYDEREWTYVKKDRTEITVQVFMTRIRAAQGPDRGFLLTATEITDEKRLEEMFLSANLQMSGVIYNLPDATFATDLKGKVIAWNRAMEEMTGIRALDILGKGNYEYALPFYGTRRPVLIDLISAHDSRIQEWGYSAVRRKENAIIAETPALDMRNMPHVLWCIAAPIFDAAGERAGAIETLADITERKREEATLKDSVKRIQQILENTGSATAIIEEDDMISYVNPEFERAIGYVREEIEGKKKWMEFVAPDDIPRMQEYRQKRKTDDPSIPARYEFRFIRWDGSVRNAFLTITHIPGTEKIVVSLIDITDKVLAEEAVQRANKKLNFFNSITRHDILNQLMVLKGNLELTREEVTDPVLMKAMAKELAAAEAIESLILFTRDYQDIGLELPVWQDVKTTIIESCAGIRLGKVSLSLEIEHVDVFADRLLEKVFSNLIQNALTHGERTSQIRFSCEESFEELHVICEDDGVGVPQDIKEKIFNRQVLRQTGLGLYIAQEILSITGISMIETGIYGEGARFEIHIPKGRYRFTGTQ
jgi:PAS domain S-box-containing protein